MMEEVEQQRTAALAEAMHLRAKALWGEETAESLRQQLGEVAWRLVELGRTVPGQDVEPGFYLIQAVGQ